MEEGGGGGVEGMGGESIDYFPIILQEESMGKARGRLFWGFSMLCGVYSKNN